MAETKDGNKVEKQLMQVLPKKIWGEIGMAISFLGREICRPTNLKFESCPINQFCYYNQKTTNKNKANYKKPKQSVFRILATTKRKLPTAFRYPLPPHEYQLPLEELLLPSYYDWL